MDPERYSFKADINARDHRVLIHARHIEQFEDVNNPLNIPRDEAKEEETMGEDMGRVDRQTKQADLPPIGSEGQAPKGGTSPHTAVALTIAIGVTPPTVVTHLRFGTIDPPNNSPHGSRRNRARQC